MANPCVICGLNMDIVGKAHRCIDRRPVNKAIIDIATVNKAVEEMKDVLSGSATWQAKWRSENTELNRKRAREGMRKKRAAEKANAS